MTSDQRHSKARVLEALERRVKQFKSREDLWPLRVPREPLPIDDVIEEALPEGSRNFEPISLRSRTLLRLEWPDGGRWDLWAIVLPSGIKIYGDSGEDETRVLASGGRNEGDASDRLLLGLLAESAGEHFGIEMSGGSPSRVRSSIDDRAFLVDLFVNLFEVTGVEGSIPRADADAQSAGRDLRTDVERWLERVMAPV